VLIAVTSLYHFHWQLINLLSTASTSWSVATTAAPFLFSSATFLLLISSTALISSIDSGCTSLRQLWWSHQQLWSLPSTAAASTTMMISPTAFISSIDSGCFDNYNDLTNSFYLFHRRRLLRQLWWSHQQLLSLPSTAAASTTIMISPTAFISSIDGGCFDNYDDLTNSFYLFHRQRLLRQLWWSFQQLLYLPSTAASLHIGTPNFEACI